MKNSRIYLSLLVSLCLISTSCSVNRSVDGVQPNIILILTDDLGYGELGCYGQQKIETPNIDKIAASGMRFTQFYSCAPVCAPARYGLLTGIHSGHAYIRGNDEWDSRGDVWNYRSVLADSTLEGQRPLKENTLTIAEVLKENGYATGMIGKWGLGAPHSASIPNNEGFGYFMGYNCQRQAHTYYPVHLYENTHRLYLNNDTVAPNTKLDKDVNPNDYSSYSDFNLNDYAPDIMFNGLSDFIDENKDRPFFLYWATPIPHAPIQAPQKWVDYYNDKFGVEEPYLGDKGYFPHPSPNAGYAAMISYLDENIGRLIEKLKDDGIYENTLIIVTSDNGPTYAGGVNAEFFNSAGPFNNGYGWTKGFVKEGGIRVPFIASWPRKIKSESVSDHIGVFYDIFPTLSEIGGCQNSGINDGISFYNAMIEGEVQKKHEYIYWEFPEYGGQQAVRIGDWKGIRKNIQKGNMDIELYNLKEDIREESNIADYNMDIVKRIKQIMIDEHSEAELDRFKMSALGDTNNTQ